MRFDSYHPTINLIYFLVAIGFTVAFDHPICLAIAYACAFAYSVKLNGMRALIFNIAIVVPGTIYGFWYAYYNHFGVTPLRQNFIGNDITLEALLYGLVLGFRVITVIMFLSCLFRIFSADKVVYLLGRISPRLSLFLSILLRMIPRVKAYGRRISLAQKGVGRGASQGNVFRRVRNIIRMASVLITWTLESFVESAASMKCRGYSLKGRTAFSIYRFDNRDRSLVVGIFTLLTLTMAGWALDQTNIYYEPQIVMNPITLWSWIFYIAYGLLLILPMVLQIIGEVRYERLAKAQYEGASA